MPLPIRARHTDSRTVTINEAELCVRMLEAATGETRPVLWTAEDALETVEPELKDQIIASARAAILYFTEQAGAVEITN